MAIGKWIGGFLGFIGGGGVLGALAGFVFGSLFDAALDYVNTPESDPNRNGRGRSQAFTSEQRAAEGQRNSFFFSLLVLSSYIIKADGKIMHSEMEYVRRFLRSQWGTAAEQQGNDILMKLFEKARNMGPADYQELIIDACHEISANMDYMQRYQLLRYLYEIAKADGVVSQQEVSALRLVGGYLLLSNEDVSSILGAVEGSSELEEAYRTLGITSKATNEEVKAAYRKQVLKYHTDRLGVNADDSMIQKINAAKEKIYKARGL